MKRTPFPVSARIALMVLAGLASSALAQETTRKVLYSLQPGETIMRAESTIAIAAGAADIVLVTTMAKDNKGPFFVVRDGKRTGPFTGIKETMATAYAGRTDSSQKNRDCASYTPPPPPEDASATTESDQQGRQVVKFKGKTFGSHLLIFSVQTTPDGALAYLTAGDNDKSWFECSDGRKVSFGGIPAEIKFSPDGKNAAVVCQGNFSMGEMNNMSKLPPEKLQAAFAEQEKKYLYTIAGKKYGPFKSSFGAHDVWFPKTSNDMYFHVNDQLFRNGAPMMKADSFDPCQFYPTPDGKAYAMLTYENIVFSDGKTYPAPLDIVVFQDGGKTVFKWITLENNKDIVVYQRAM
ncbi:MAG: hypothetical protein ABSF88_11280 [Candidatus Aminicenantales bacterium]